MLKDIDKMHLIHEVKRSYGECFDEVGNVRIVGRNECIALITYLEQLFPEAGSFGSTKTGFMDVDKIKQYRQKLD